MLTSEAVRLVECQVEVSSDATELIELFLMFTSTFD